MTPRTLQQSIIDLANDIRWNMQKYLHESVFFYTFHKTASSLFSNYVLENVRYLRHVDYDRMLYRGIHLDKIEYRKNGFIYGPIRISIKPDSPLYQPLVAPACSNEFVRDKTAVFLIRDPRDILISSYYSSGFSHVLSPVREIRQQQLLKRNEILGKTLDDFALDSASEYLSYFETLDRLQRASKRNVIIRYEDMINNWEQFVAGLTTLLKIEQPVLDHMYTITRPMQTENKELHRRSGKTGQYEHKFSAATVASLNETFREVLERYQYEI